MGRVQDATRVRGREGMITCDHRLFPRSKKSAKFDEEEKKKEKQWKMNG